MSGINIGYELTPDFRRFPVFIKNFIREKNIENVLEIGGGANPAISIPFIKAEGINYTVLDISEEELSKASNAYHKIRADIAASNLTVKGNFDLVFSNMLAEHVENGLYFHENVYNLLNNFGYAIHVFPTLFAIPYLINLLLPESMGRNLIFKIVPGRDQIMKAKFPAYYKWCFGPTRKQVKRFQSIGFTIEEYVGYYGHREYYYLVRWMQSINDVVSGLLVKHPIPWMTSYARVTLSK